MRYLPHTKEDVSSMLKAIGAERLEDLFANIPKECRFDKKLDLPEPLTEIELSDLLGGLSRSIATSPKYKVFIGAGSYEHFIPAVVNHLAGRSEFATSYTPYQPEISQGTLQALYEYQTLTARLLGMEVANASLYDGASALAEALFMAIRITKKTKVAVSSLIHPHYRQVIKAYFKPTAYEIIEVPYLDNGRTDFAKISEIDDIAAFAVQSPNFFGSIEDLKTLCKQAKRIDALFITCFTEPLAYGLLKNPGSLGADIVCGDGQSLGIAQSFGGPALGMFASKNEYVRKMPGRLVGKTSDVDGKRGFVLTLATREQHIRREKATSNICTNSSLNALSAAIYMACLGGTGMRELALLNHDKAEYLKAALKKAGVKIRFKAPTFNEFVIKVPAGFGAVYERLLEKNMVAGLPLSKFYPELDNEYLLCVTETKTKKDMDDLVKEIKS
jgi:glycine dehydrogenase subunit 1